jgi:hypothetical protein
MELHNEKLQVPCSSHGSLRCRLIDNGSAIAQEISQRFPTRFDLTSDHVGFVVDELALGHVSSSTPFLSTNSH